MRNLDSISSNENASYLKTSQSLTFVPNKFHVSFLCVVNSGGALRVVPAALNPTLCDSTEICGNGEGAFSTASFLSRKQLLYKNGVTFVKLETSAKGLLVLDGISWQHSITPII